MRPISTSPPSLFPLLLIVLSVLPLTFAQTCSNYGTPSSSSSSSCLCPPGFTRPQSNDCTLPTCGGSLYVPAGVAPGGTSGLGNVSAGDCGCTSGWTGPGCTVCTSSSACQSSVSKYLNSSTALATAGSSALNSTLTCSTVPSVYSVSELSCTVIQTTLQQLFPGTSILTITRSLNASLSPGGETVLTYAGIESASNTIWAQLWYNGVEQFYCQGSNCSQAVNAGSNGINGSVWTCPTLSCLCRPGADFCGGPTAGSSAANLTSDINTLVTGPLTIDCAPGGTCYFKQNFLNSLFGSSGLQMTSCSFGECVAQYVIDQALGITAATSTSSGLSGGVIAGLAVVGAILLAIVAVVIYGLVLRSRARRVPPPADGALPKAGGVGLAWSAVTYEVVGRNDAWARTVAWLKGSGGIGNGSRLKLPETEAGDEVAVGADGAKVILRDACGTLPPGAFCCVLGPSGAGKSTLVDVLAGKRKAGRVQGNVRFDAERRVRIGYVDQSDILSPTSTVLETLLFAAYLRLPENIPKSIKQQRAHDVLDQLGLEHVKHTRVGSVERRGISGGEMRRVSIGIELVASPDVLVLDEPTSGLDSVSASRLVKLLKSLAASGTTIVASIHQPSSALYHDFSQVVLLAKGRQLYFGPGGSAPAIYFASIGRPCPQGYNIADHLLEIASGSIDGIPSGPASVVSPSASNGSNGSPEPGSHVSSSLSSGGGQEEVPIETPFEKQMTRYPPTNEGIDLAHLEDPNAKTWWPDSHCATTFLTQVEVLSSREWKNLKRDKTLLIAHVGLACILGVFAGGLYFKVGLTIAGFQNRVGSLFFLGSLIAFSSLSALYNLVEIRPLFLRERAGSFYSPHSWLLSRVLFDVIPLRLIPTILVSIIVYFMVGLSREPARFFKYLLILVEYSLSMTLFNFLLACVFRHGGIAILLSSLWNLFLMTYAGFFVNLSQIPPVLRWLRWFSTLGYTLEALSINEVGSGLQIIDELDGVAVEISAIVIMQTLFGFDLGNYYRDVLVLFAFIAGFAILLVFTVLFLLRERR